MPRRFDIGKPLSLPLLWFLILVLYAISFPLACH